MRDEMVYCQNCKHIRRQDIVQCSHPKARVFDPVEGPSMVPCYVARGDKGPCGFGGALYQPVDPRHEVHRTMLSISLLLIFLAVAYSVNYL